MATLSTPASIDAFRLRIIIMHARCKVRGGMQLTRPGAQPRLQDVCRQYGITAHTWKDALPKLEALGEG